MAAPRFPGSNTRYFGKGTTYGPLPDHDKGPLEVVFHTTETKGMPGFNNGDTAPHYVYDATNKEWFVWSDVDRRVGTMKGHATNHCNCDSIQVEILGYSDSRYDPWVGDFDDQDYEELASFFAWAMEEGLVADGLTPQPVGGWLYGANSTYRLSEDEWYAFSGLTAHGAAPGNSHWDTGVLDLVRIHDLATGGSVPPEPVDPTDCIPDWALQYWQPYVDQYWPGGAPDPCAYIMHYEMANILAKAGLLEMPSEE